MEKELKKLNTLKKISLGKNEKDILRSAVLEFAQNNPLQSKIESPYFFIFSPLNIRIYSGVFAILFLVIYTNSSENALPGSSMYYFKTHINEEVIKHAAFTPQSQADASITLLRRRYEEAAKLSLNKEAAPEDWNTLQTELKKTSSEAKVKVQELVSNNEYAQAASLLTDQETILSANEKILSTIASDIDNENVLNVLTELKTHQDSNSAIVASIVPSLDDQTISDETKESFTDSTDILQEAQDKLIEEKDSGDTESSDQLDSAITLTKQLIDEGIVLLDSGDNSAAFLKFEKAKKTLATVLVLNDAENELGIEIDNLIASSSPSIQSDQ